VARIQQHPCEILALEFGSCHRLERFGQDGKGCKVRVRKGRRLVEGWLTFYFIQELK